MNKIRKGQIAYGLLISLLIEQRHGGDGKGFCHEKVKAMMSMANSFTGGSEFAHILCRELADNIFFGQEISPIESLNVENKWKVAYEMLVGLTANSNGDFHEGKFVAMNHMAESLYKDDGREFMRIVGKTLVDRYFKD